MDMDYINEMDFGKGFDTVEVRVRGSCVEGTGVKETMGGGAPNTEFHLKLIESNKSLFEAVTIDAKANARIGLFSAAAKFNLSKETSTNSYHAYLVASIVITNPYEELQHPRLTLEAKEMISNGDYARFREQYGDLFILGCRKGGCFHGIMDFYTEDDQSKESLKAKISAGYLGTFSTNGAIRTTIEKLSHEEKLEVHSIQIGGDYSSQVHDLDTMIAKIENFPSEVKEKAEPILISLQDYAVLDMPKPPSFIDVSNSILVLNRYADIRNQLIGMMADIDFILTHQEQFINPDVPALNNWNEQIADSINKITSCASACSKRVMDCKFVAPEIPAIKLPARKSPLPESSGHSRATRRRLRPSHRDPLPESSGHSSATRIRLRPGHRDT